MIGKRIKDLRKSKKITQDELGSILGLSGKSAISNYENGYSAPDNDMLNKIADYFNVSTDYLLGRTEDPEYGELTLEEMEMSRIRISSLRDFFKISAKKLSRDLCYWDYVIKDVESGEHDLDRKMIDDIAVYFGVPSAYILGHTDNPNLTIQTATSHTITLADWPAFLAQLPEDQAMHYQNTDYPDEEKIVIMEEAEKAKQRKLKKIEKFMQYPVEVIDDALIYAAFDAEQRKKMKDEN